jgi:phosphate:Na+ symporter
MILSLFTLLGALGMFLYGMNLMSSGLQKAAGDKMRNLLSSMTSTPFKGVLTGFGVTSIIQSSSATTVMVVGFVSAGLLTLGQAIGVIMGANIGTTMTAWIISIFGFKADISILAVPLMAVGFILNSMKKDKVKSIGEFIIGFALLFLGLSLMKNSIPDLQSTPQVLSFIQGWSGKGFLSIILFLLLGTVLTLILQSSSATVALTLIMLNMGWLEYDMAAAMVLGENIGTTITANIAAMVGNINAKRAALAHTFFNVFGVIWAVAFFHPFVSLVQWVVSLLGVDEQTSLVYGISMFHTLFNLINTCILIWFTKVIEKIVTWVIKDKKSSVKEPNRITYLDSGLIDTPELAISEACKETTHFAKVMKNGLEYIRSAITSSDTKESFQPYKEKLIKYEEISDRIEYEVATFLNKLDKSHISDRSSELVRALLRICKELESIGDSGESVSKSLGAMIGYSRSLSSDHKEKLLNMVSLLDKAYEAMISNLENYATIRDISNAVEAEKAVNEYRKTCRKAEYDGLEKDSSPYFESVFFLDVLEELEKIGDYMINVSEALLDS